MVLCNYSVIGILRYWWITKQLSMCQKQLKTPTRLCKTLLLKLSEFTIDLKYQKDSKMYTSAALSRLHNLTDSPNNKDIMPLNFLQHILPNYIKHSYVQNADTLYVHKTKDIDATKIKRKKGLPLKKVETKPKTPKPAATTRTRKPRQTKTKSVSEQLIDKINTEKPPPMKHHVVF